MLQTKLRERLNIEDSIFGFERVKRMRKFYSSLLTLILLTSIVAIIFVGYKIGSVEAQAPTVGTGSPQAFDSRPNNHFTDVGFAVTDPAKAYDGNSSSRANFVYSSGTGQQKALELYNFTSPYAGGPWASKGYSPLPSISGVDFNMKYNVSENTNLARDDQYRIVYRVTPSVTVGVLTDWRNDYTANTLYVNGFADARLGWLRYGSSPYLGAVDYPTNYVGLGETIRPDANGLYTAWTGDYTAVDEVDPHDGNTTYIMANAHNLNESVNLASVGGSPSWTIGYVTLTIVARQSTGADEQVRMMLVIDGRGYNGSEFVAGDLVTPKTTYQAYSYSWSQNPGYAVFPNGTAVSGAWNWTAITNLQAGVRSQRFGATWSGEIRITQMYVDVVMSNQNAGDFAFADLPGAYGGGKIYLDVNAASNGDGNDDLNMYLWNSTSFVWIGSLTPVSGSFGWQSIDVTSIINSTAGVNGAKVYFSVSPSGGSNNLKIDAVRLRINNLGWVDVPSTITWANVNEPNNGVWDWTDVNNIRFAVETSRVGTADTGCNFWEFEAWVTVKSPPAQFKMAKTSIDTTSTPPTTVTLTPMSDAVTETWSINPTSPATHFDKVDEASQNGDTDYIYATATARTDIYGITDPVGPPAWTIGAVRVVAYAKYAAAGPDEKLYGAVRVGTTIYASTTGFALTTSYAKYSWDFASNPGTLVDWTWADITALQAGVRCLATGGWTGEMRVTQVYVEVLGPRFGVNLRAEGASNLWGYSLIVRYNTAVLTAVGKAGIAPFTSASASGIFDAQGEISFGFSMVFGTTVGTFGNVTLGTVYFLPDAVGVSNLDMYDTKLTTPVGGNLPHNVYDVDVDVTAVTPSATIAYLGYLRNVSVTVQNKVYHTYNVTVDAYITNNVTLNSYLIRTRNVTNLAAGGSSTFNIVWNTTGVPYSYGFYDITIIASLSSNDASSRVAAQRVMLTIPGDVTGDRIVDVFDILKLKFHRSGPPPGPGGYLRDADINDDAVIDVFDILIAKAHLGQSW